MMTLYHRKGSGLSAIDRCHGFRVERVFTRIERFVSTCR